MKLLSDIRNSKNISDQIRILSNMGHYCASREFTSKEILEIKQFFDDVINNRKCDIKPKDYRPSTIMKQWVNLMNF